MTLQDIEKFFRDTYPTAARVCFEVDHTGSALRVIHEVPTTMHAVWGLDRVEQFPPQPSPVTQPGDSRG